MDLKKLAKSHETFTQQMTGVGVFKDFDATELYCPRCKRAVSVRKRLLLVLPEGDKHEYLCAFCLESVGTKIDRCKKELKLIV